MNLALLAYEMKLAGIKSLALELSDDSSGSPAIAHSEERATLAPGDLPPAAPEPEQKGENQCAFPGCGGERRGLFGGVGSAFCRNHALQKAGVRT